MAGDVSVFSHKFLLFTFGKVGKEEGCKKTETKEKNHIFYTFLLTTSVENKRRKNKSKLHFRTFASI